MTSADSLGPISLSDQLLFFFLACLFFTRHNFIIYFLLFIEYICLEMSVRGATGHCKVFQDYISAL